jgi:NADH-quinone oxidoreductase subunit L
MVENIWLIPLLPLVGAVLMLLTGRRLPKIGIDLICVGSVVLSFAVSAGAVLQNGSQTREVILYEWLPLLKADWAYLLDPLSSVMILVVTGIGALIHIYATGYMAHEGGYYRFFGYLNLFVFFMLTLVLANNYALLFVGWEGVGLCSYLLIGFYFHKKSAGDAGKKAFIVNRVGDWGFLMGMFMVWTLLGSVRFTEITHQAHELAPESGFGLLTVATLCLFIGATGKSAQFPLYVWLPDAMEGPTPVSALIHAATMVTAGVYVVARSSALFHLTPLTLEIVAAIGAFTAILAASIGLVQNDIKRVLAYSTVSQLGFMFMALGVGAYWVAVFHLVTHAFFKALLFLCSGSVIHGMHGEQDMRHMGGLKKYMPITHATMLIGSLAIAGVPGLAGFFSKEEILTSAFLTSKAVYAVGLVTAVMTAFYMFRLMRMTFYGAERFDRHHIHPHESPWSMAGPLVVLAAGSVLVGWLNAGIAGIHAFSHYLEPVFPAHEAHHLDAGLAGGLLIAALAAAAIGIFVALKTNFDIKGRLHKILYNKWYVDEIYDFVFVNGMAKKGGLLLGSFDRNVVDGGVNGAAWLTRFNSRLTIFWDTWIIDGFVRAASFLVWLAGYPARMVQTGYVQTYALFVVLGLLAMFGMYVTQS